MLRPRAALQIAVLLSLCGAVRTDELSLSGVVVTPDGKPAARVRVWVRTLEPPEGAEAQEPLPLGPDGPLAATTDERGAFVIAGLPARSVAQLAVAWPVGEPLLIVRPLPGRPNRDPHSTKAPGLDLR
jgi:hypothetical protein